MKPRAFKPIIIIAFIAVVSTAVMLLWNSIIPSVIGWGKLSYMQSAGLFILCRLLFGGFREFKTRAKVALGCKNSNIKEEIDAMSRNDRAEYIRQFINAHNNNEQ